MALTQVVCTMQFSAAYYADVFCLVWIHLYCDLLTVGHVLFVNCWQNLVAFCVQRLDLISP